MSAHIVLSSTGASDTARSSRRNGLRYQGEAMGSNPLDVVMKNVDVVRVARFQ